MTLLYDPIYDIPMAENGHYDSAADVICKTMLHFSDCDRYEYRIAGDTRSYGCVESMMLRLLREDWEYCGRLGCVTKPYYCNHGLFQYHMIDRDVQLPKVKIDNPYLAA